jgi:hypothetical protein
MANTIITASATTSAMEIAAYLRKSSSEGEIIIDKETGYFLRDFPLSLAALSMQQSEREFSPVDEAYGILSRGTSPERSADVTSEIETSLSKLRSKVVELPNSEEVRDYLLKYSDMTHLLSYVTELLREKIGWDPQLSLEVYHDPEIQDEYLTIYVRKDNYDEKFLDMIDDIGAEFEEYLIEKSGWLIVTTDFRVPR